MRGRWWLSGFLVLGWTAGCAALSPHRAPAEQTAPAYRAFLRDHPDHGDAAEVRGRLSELEFKSASERHTVLAYRTFLEEFPDSAEAGAARKRLETLRFEEASARGGATALRQFLRDHPDGTNAARARELLAAAVAEEARSERDPEALLSPPADGPLDPVRDARAFEAAASLRAFGLLRYLREFPAGAHRDEARARLLSLKLEGLLSSGLVARAQEESTRDPLAARVPKLAQRLASARAHQAALRAADATVQSALAGFYARPLEDLVVALKGADPLERWQAAEELSQHVSVEAIDPLLGAIRAGRNLLVRWRAFESLQSILAALPAEVRDYELAARAEQLRELANSPELFLAEAVVLDLAGRLAEAAPAYQRAHEAGEDPFVLMRWTQLRRSRGQSFSAAVAGRRVALWAIAESERHLAVGPAVSRPSVRGLCAAERAAQFAAEAIGWARSQPTEFPEDLAAFAATAQQAVQLTSARLQDAELVLLRGESSAKRCSDRSVAERLAEGESRRKAALEVIAARKGATRREVLTRARERDPSPAVRSHASALLGP